MYVYLPLINLLKCKLFTIHIKVHFTAAFLCVFEQVSVILYIYYNFLF